MKLRGRIVGPVRLASGTGGIGTAEAVRPFATVAGGGGFGGEPVEDDMGVIGACA